MLVKIKGAFYFGITRIFKSLRHDGANFKFLTFADCSPRIADMRRIDSFGFITVCSVVFSG
jgi:hypothetical protein